MLRLSERHMNNLNQQRVGTGRFVARCVTAGVAYASLLFAGLLHAAGEVTEIQTSEQLGTPSSYSIDGTTYTWGMGSNQIMDGFIADSVQYSYASSADRVELRRHDVLGVSTGNPCGVFVERLGTGSEILKANYPSDGTDTGNCDMAAMLQSRVVNRGALDLFSNTGANPKNVERVDYIYDRGVLAPLTVSSLAKSGHVVAEKRGNNPLQIAAITSIDIFGQPSSFGPLVLVDRKNCADPTVCYGVTNLRHNYSFFQNNSLVPQGYPSYLQDSTESVGMAFVSLDKLGLVNGQIYYGFSYFPDDVDAAVHTLTDVTTFPADTNDEKIVFGDGPDIYGGVSGYFLAESLSVANGAVFKDEDGDGGLSGTEAGISDIGLTLYQDSNGNGVYDRDADGQIGPSFDTDVAGNFHIPGLDDGVYFLLLDEADADLPPAISLVPGTNPQMIVINGNDADGIRFGFISNTGATDSGGDDAGSADAGAGGDAGTDAGTDTGASDAGTDAGASDAGTDAGTDTGASDAGTDAGTDTGASDAGTDAGTDTGASDAGTSDAGSDTGASDAGGTDAGSTDSGSGDDFIIINDGVNATVANPDSETVNHGSSVLIPVLENDTDASGLGLTIISTSESANATIVIQDSVIKYSPDVGFHGTDSFLYVIEDGAGTQSTGTVSVNVLRFSDINNNGLNDFVECECDNLTIEVGVEGSALGSSSLFASLVLWLFYCARRIGYARRASGFGVKP